MCRTIGKCLRVVFGIQNVWGCHCTHNNILSPTDDYRTTPNLSKSLLSRGPKNTVFPRFVYTKKILNLYKILLTNTATWGNRNKRPRFSQILDHFLTIIFERYTVYLENDGKKMVHNLRETGGGVPTSRFLLTESYYNI